MVPALSASVLFLTTRERTVLSISCAVLLLDSTEVAFGVTERVEGIFVSDWEVPTPPVHTHLSADLKTPSCLYLVGLQSAAEA